MLMSISVVSALLKALARQGEGLLVSKLVFSELQQDRIIFPNPRSHA